MTNPKFKIGQVFGSPSVNGVGNLVGYRLVCDAARISNGRYVCIDSIIIATWADQPSWADGVEAMSIAFMEAFMRGEIEGYASAGGRTWFPIKIGLLSPSESTTEDAEQLSLEIAKDEWKADLHAQW